MNLPGINNKMKSHNNHFKQDNSLADGFGLGIQVFKIQSAKNIDANLKNKNRNMIKNIQNPTQTTNYKQPLIPKPKKLPSLEKSNSQINSKQRISAFINSKMPPTHTGYSDKINERKIPVADSNNIVTPVSFSMRKKVGVSTEKNIGVNQSSKPAYLNNSSKDQKQKVINKVTTMKLNQTAPPQTVSKVPQIPYQDYHSQHGVIIKFYGQYQSSQKQHLKEIKQLKKLKQNEENEQICDRIEYLQSVQGKIESVIQNMEKQQFQDRTKLLQKEDDKKNKRMTNRIIPVCGFSMTQADLFDYNGIEDYQLGNFAGSFKSPDYQNIDFAPQAIINEKDQ